MVSFSILGFSAFNCAIAYIVICDQWKNNAVRPSSFRIPRERERIKLKKAEKIWTHRSHQQQQQQVTSIVESQAITFIERKSVGVCVCVYSMRVRFSGFIGRKFPASLQNSSAVVVGVDGGWCYAMFILSALFESNTFSKWYPMCAHALQILFTFLFHRNILGFHSFSLIASISMRFRSLSFAFSLIFLPFVI